MKSDLTFSLRIIYACLGTLRRKIFFSRDCPIYHTKSRINCITFILEILFQYRWVPRTRPRERCTRLFVACLIIIVQEHTWILVKTRNNWSSMSTLISNVRFRAKFSTIFRLWNAYSAFFQRLCSILMCGSWNEIVWIEGNGKQPVSIKNNWELTANYFPTRVLYTVWCTLGMILVQ